MCERICRCKKIKLRIKSREWVFFFFFFASSYNTPPEGSEKRKDKRKKRDRKTADFYHDAEVISGTAWVYVRLIRERKSGMEYATRWNGSVEKCECPPVTMTYDANLTWSTITRTDIKSTINGHENGRCGYSLCTSTSRPVTDHF